MHHPQWRQPSPGPPPGADPDGLPSRSADQQHVPPSPASSSISDDGFSGGSRSARRGAPPWERGPRASPQSQPQPQPYIQHYQPHPRATHNHHHTHQHQYHSPQPDPLLAKVHAANNWFELRAVLLTSGGTGSSQPHTRSHPNSAPPSTSPDLILAVLRRLCSITRYAMGPREAAALSSFLEPWLLSHSAALTQMDPYQLATCLHSLARMRAALAAPPGRWLAAWWAAAQPHLAAAAFRPKHLSLAAWALSRLRLRLPAAGVGSLLAAAEPHLGAFNAQDLSLFALALSALRQGEDLAAAGRGAGGSSKQGEGWAAEAAAVHPPAAGQGLGPASAGGAAPGRPPRRDDAGVGNPPATASLALSQAGTLPDAAWLAWQARFFSRAAVVLPGCDPQAAANLLHGAVHAGLDVPPSLLAALVSELYGHLPHCPPQALANVLSALAALGWAPPRAWTERLWAVSAERMGGVGAAGEGSSHDRGPGLEHGPGGERGAHGQPGAVCNTDDLTHLAAAAARLRLAPPHWWTSRMYSALGARLGAASARQLAQALHAGAELHRATAGGAAEHIVADAATGVGDGRGGPGVDAARPPRAFIAAWHRAAAAALPHFNAVDASHALWALAALGEAPSEPWLQQLLVVVRGGLRACPPGELAMLLWALAALRHRPTWAWLQDATEAAVPRLGAMRGQDWVVLTAALARLGCRPSAGWVQALLAATRPRLRGLGLRCLALTAWGMYRLRIQPPPEWLEECAGALRARCREAGAGEGVEGQEEEGPDGRQRLRHTVLLLWVLSRWLGRGRPGSEEGAELVERESQQDSLQRPQAPPAVTAPRRCRLRARRLRRRRAVRPGSLHAALHGDVGTVAAPRHRIAAAAIGPALAATEPLLQHATDQDLSLALSALAALPVEARRALASSAPGWAPALLAATLPRLQRLQPAALEALLGGLAALRVRVGPEWVAAAARAAAPYLTARAPAAAKVTLLRRLATVLPQEPSDAAASGEGCGARAALLRTAVGSLREASEAALPLARLRAEQIKARIRFRKLSAAAAGARSGARLQPGAAAANPVPVPLWLRRGMGVPAAAAAAASSQAASAGMQPSGATRMGRATGHGHQAAAVDAAVAVSSRYSLSSLTADTDAVRRVVRQAAGPAGRLPPVSEVQRPWIWRRAQRWAASHAADSSPVLVAQLVSLVAAEARAGQRAQAAASTRPSDVRSTSSCNSSTAEVNDGNGAGHGSGLKAGSSSYAGGSGGRSSCASAGSSSSSSSMHAGPGGSVGVAAADLLWLAAASGRCLRRMPWVHRARTRAAWAALLGALGQGGEGLRVELLRRLGPLGTAGMSAARDGSADGAGAAALAEVAGAQAATVVAGSVVVRVEGGPALVGVGSVV